MYCTERKVADCEKMNAEIWEKITAYGFPSWEELAYETRDKATGEKRVFYIITERNWVDNFNYLHCYGLNKWGHVSDDVHKPYDEVLERDIRDEARPARWFKEKHAEITEADWTAIEGAAREVIYKWSSGYIRKARELEDYIRNRDKATATN